ncbi:DNA directed DNA polymerase [Caudoviricetes sp.]|nr:DNA directed DNA polymerase [Caudoviricetes sp.]UOF82739.1 DNA directed DNA polymerase [Caudoviricetes sp.]
MAKAAIEKIDALAELERIGWRWESSGDNEVKLLCPAHEDSTPSASLNVDTKLWRCMACQAKGDIVTFIGYALKTKRSTILVDLGKRYDIAEIKSISPEVVEKHHQKIWESGPLLAELRKRGVSDNAIRAARLGFFEGRITIPIYDVAGNVVNLRRYLPGAAEMKMLNAKGFSKPQLYQASQLAKHRDVWVCGGELKALVVSDLLADKKIAAVASTHGEGSWQQEWLALFKGKRVWVCMDIDGAGQRAARLLANMLSSFAEKVRIITLPLDKTKHPKGDINDFVGQEKATGDDLLRLMSLAKDWIPEKIYEEVEKGTKEVTLDKIGSPSNIGYRLQFEAIISAADTTPYLVPKEVDVSCSRDQPLCAQCPVKLREQDDRGYVRMEISTVSRGIVEMVNAAKSSQRLAVRDSLQIPDCKTVDFVTVSHMSATDVRLSPQLQIGSEGGGNIQQPALIVDRRIELNSPQRLRGKMYPHPRTQQAVLVVDESEDAADSLSTFSPSEGELRELDKYRPADDSYEALREKLDYIWASLEDNVTGVYGRRTLHAAVDATYHSVMGFELDGKACNGWMNVMVLGDSSQGKTEATSTLMKHYQLGERVECKNASVAGLLGGLAQIGTRWFVSWGVIPMHDRRLVILEEVKGASTEVLSKLTDMRSSGIAEIPKIERRRARARTRLLFVSNPRGSRSLSSYGYACEAAQELMGSLEDVRRFDFVTLVQSGAVDVEAERQKRKAAKAEVISDQETARRLILWAWTRRADQVRFSTDTLEALSRASAAMCSRFSEDLPLVDRGTMKLKLARFATALAARTFSRRDDELMVGEQHVTAAWRIIEDHYSEDSFGYVAFTKSRRILGEIKEPELVKKFVQSQLKHPDDFVSGMLRIDEVTAQDVQDLCEADRDAAQGIVSLLVRAHCLRRQGKNGYSKTPAFIQLLKELESTVRKTSVDDGADM